MKKILEILTLLVFVTLALSVWADDYVDDVYYWTETPQAPSKGEVQNEAKVTANGEKVVSNGAKVAQASDEQGAKTIEFLPQTADTVVVIRVKK